MSINHLTLRFDTLFNEMHTVMEHAEEPGENPQEHRIHLEAKLNSLFNRLRVVLGNIEEYLGYNDALSTACRQRFKRVERDREEILENQKKIALQSRKGNSIRARLLTCLNVKIPADLQLTCFTFLDLNSQANVNATCLEWNQLGQAAIQEQWKELFECFEFIKNVAQDLKKEDVFGWLNHEGLIHLLNHRPVVSVNKQPPVSRTNPKRIKLDTPELSVLSVNFRPEKIKSKIIALFIKCWIQKNDENLPEKIQEHLYLIYNNKGVSQCTYLPYFKALLETSLELYNQIIQLKSIHTTQNRSLYVQDMLDHLFLSRSDDLLAVEIAFLIYCNEEHLGKIEIKSYFEFIATPLFEKGHIEAGLVLISALGLNEGVPILCGEIIKLLGRDQEDHAMEILDAIEAHGIHHHTEQACRCIASFYIAEERYEKLFEFIYEIESPLIQRRMRSLALAHLSELIQMDEWEDAEQMILFSDFELQP